ncbi:MAG: HAMP domain-containing sensor histidine kinase [Candidatus Thiodiazotropha endolucinida]
MSMDITSIERDWPQLARLVRDQATALAIGLFNTEGEALYLNRGMRDLLGGNHPTKPRINYFVNPHFSDFWTETEDGETFNGMFNVGDGLRVNRTIKVQSWRQGDSLLIVGEFDVLELDRLNAKLSRTNQEINNLERKLIKQNRMLEETLIELKQTQSQLVEAEKMASLGIMVAGVAHEINTPAGISLITLSSLLQRLDRVSSVLGNDSYQNSDLSEYLNTTREGLGLVKNNIQRIADLVVRFKQVSMEQGTDRHREVSLKSYLNSVVHNLGTRLEQGRFFVHIDCDPELKIESYPGALAQIVTNLLINSLDHGFKDRINGEIHLKVNVGRGELILEYQDNGCGIAPTDMGKLFDPFFTTDLQGHTGLGLYVVYNLVTQKLQGKIACHSELGEGTRFEIRLPLRRGEEFKKRECETV